MAHVEERLGVSITLGPALSCACPIYDLDGVGLFFAHLLVSVASKWAEGVGLYYFSTSSFEELPVNQKVSVGA
jgi:hypothetical protein